RCATPLAGVHRRSGTARCRTRRSSGAEALGRRVRPGPRSRPGTAPARGPGRTSFRTPGTAARPHPRGPFGARYLTNRRIPVEGAEPHFRDHPDIAVSVVGY